MTKTEVLSDIMYELRFKDSLDIEVDDCSYSIDSLPENRYRVAGVSFTQIVKGKSELRKAIAKLGRNIVQM